MAKRTRGVVPVAQLAVTPRLVTLEDVVTAFERLEQEVRALRELQERHTARGHILRPTPVNTGSEYQ